MALEWQSWALVQGHITSLLLAWSIQVKLELCERIFSLHVPLLPGQGGGNGKRPSVLLDI